MIDEKFYPIVASGSISILTAGMIRGRPLITPNQAALLATSTVMAALTKARSSMADQAVEADPMVSEMTDAVVAEINRRVSAQAASDLALEREIALEIVGNAAIPEKQN